PLRRVPGIVGLTEPLSVPLRSIVVSPEIGIRPDRDGRALLHSYRVDATLPQSFAQRHAGPAGAPAQDAPDADPALGAQDRGLALLRDGISGVAGLGEARVS